MYIVSFDVIGMCLALVLVLGHVFLFDKREPSHKHFFLFVSFVALECLLDIITAKGIDGFIHFSDRTSIILNAVYFMALLLSPYLGFRLVLIHINFQNKKVKNIGQVAFITSMVLQVLNIFTGFMFTFVNGEYIKTPWFAIDYIISYIYLVLISYALFSRRKDLVSRELVAPYFLIIVIISTFLIQIIFPSILLNGFGKALAAVVFCFYLEKPEHIKLLAAVNELKEAQKDNIAATEAARVANEAKKDFLISMSHEFRTPINSILGFDEIIYREAADENIRNMAANLYYKGEEILDLVDNIIDFAQIETGAIEFIAREYNVDEIYQTIYRHLHKMGDDKNLIFKTIISEEMPKRLYGDEGRICKILEEITKYIIKQNIAGNISLYIDVNHIDYNMVYIDFKIKFVSDSRCIFDESTKKDIEYIFISKILEAMESQIEITFENGENIFSFIFKQEIVDMKPIGDISELIRKNSEKQENADYINKFILPSANILVVDDISINLKVFEGLLAPYKANLVKAVSGYEALEYMKEQSFDMVFMDILMPDMDGVETLHRIRTEEKIISRDVTVVALTANVFIGAREKYISDGFADYITKPINSRVLENALSKFLPDKIEEEWAEVDVQVEDEYRGVEALDSKYSSFLGESEDGYGSFLSEEDTSGSYSSFLPEEDTSDSYSNFLSDDSQTENTGNGDLFEMVPGLNVQAGLEFCLGNMELYMDVLGDYCNNNSKEKLTQYYEQGDWENYRILIHGVKNSSKTIGHNSLFEGAKKLEDAARNLELVYIHENHSVWLSEYELVVDRIREYVLV